MAPRGYSISRFLFALGITLNMLRMGSLTLVESVLNVSLSLGLIDGTKENIHVLQSSAFGLLQEDGDKDSHGSAEDTEHEESPPANMVHSPGSDLRNDEVEQPLGCGSHADTV